MTARAPVNIAVIKYWGKKDKKLKLPINDSISATLNLDDMCTTTTVHISPNFNQDKLFLNGKEQEIQLDSPVKIMLDDIRSLSTLDRKVLEQKALITSINNFPTAAGLASSAAGYACLAYALGSAYGIFDRAILSRVARKGSGSACRSVYGGFVQWVKGNDHETSLARQITDHKHWPEMRVVICIVNEKQKDVSSSLGMSQSVDTSSLIDYRAKVVVPERVKVMEKAILEKDFETFAELTMKDSNQFHAICLDTYPPIFYLNDTSRLIIRICSLINQYYKRLVVAYTFDAGPNACIFTLDEYASRIVTILRDVFPLFDEKNESISELPVRGSFEETTNDAHDNNLVEFLKSSGVLPRPNLLSYIISTSIGDGPSLTSMHLSV